MAAFAIFALAFAACKETPEPEPGPGPDGPTPPKPIGLTFDVEIGETTYSSFDFVVTPSDLNVEYLCLLYDVASADEFTKDEYLVSTLYQELTTEARANGMTFEEYMPEIVDRGILDSSFSGLRPETEYYLILFGVDAEMGYNASTELTKIKIITLEAPSIDVSFAIDTVVDGNSAKYTVTPSNDEVIWYFYTVPTAAYEAYTDPAGSYQMDDKGFILYCLQMQLDQLLGAGYSAQEIINLIFHKGTLTLQAEGLNSNTEYTNLVAAFDISEEGEITIISDVTTSEYTTGDPEQVAMTFEVSVTDVDVDRAAIKITPSDLKQTFCWMVGAWDGQKTAEEIMNEIVGMYGAWMNNGMMLYSGVQDYTGGPGSSYKYKLDAPDTDYYVIAFGYAGGITTEPEMVTFRTLPAPPASETEFTMSASDITPYGLKIGIGTSVASTYYTMDVCTPESFDEATIVSETNAAIKELLEMQQQMDPNFTIANLLGMYFYKGGYTVSVTGMAPETTYMGYILAIDHTTGEVAKVHKFENLATTLPVGSVQPKVELVGHYSGKEENGSIFGQPTATAEKAITVIKYSEFDGARSLFSTMLGDDMTNVNNYPDTNVWGMAAQYWGSVKLSQPYSFYITDWDYGQTALAYAVDANGLPGGIGRLYTMPTAENKGDIEELRALVNELNSADKSASFVLPASIVVSEAEGIKLTAEKIDSFEPMAEVESAPAPVCELPSNRLPIAAVDYVRPFYLHK